MTLLRSAMTTRLLAAAAAAFLALPPTPRVTGFGVVALPPPVRLVRQPSPATTMLPYRQWPSTTAMFGARRWHHDRGNSDDGDDALARNLKRTDIRNFLTQRALQSFVFLLAQCRDEATVHWLEVFTRNAFRCRCG